MIMIIVGVLLLLVVGGLLGYILGVPVAAFTTAFTAWMPALSTDPYFVFAGDVWYWMPLFIIVIALAWETVNAQMQRGANY
jgi:uncharacterized membrane protein